MIIQGDCIEELRKLEGNSVDAIITDPPYGIGFMGKEWDNFKPSTIKEGMDKDKRPKTQIASTRISNIAGTYDKSISGVKGFQIFCEEWSKEALRVLKPGGYMLVSCSTRMYHRMTCGIEDAGFEIRDTIMWLYGSGFPKSLNIGKQIDKLNGKKQEEFIALGKYIKEKRGDILQNKISKFFPSKTGGLTGCVSNWELGMNVPTKEQWIILKRELKLDSKFDYLIDRIEAEREVIGKDGRGELKEDMFFSQDIEKAKENGKSIGYGKWDVTAPNLPEAKQWEGWGTALKPACEPIVVARKPLSEKNVALNVLKHGTGGMNIDECRIKYLNDNDRSGWHKSGADGSKGFQGEDTFKIRPISAEEIKERTSQGRFPANIILDEEAGKMLNEQSGESNSNVRIDNQTKVGEKLGMFEGGWKEKGNIRGHTDKGGASRFFYCAKASKSERNLGCEEFEEKYKSHIQTQNFENAKTGSGNERKIVHKNNHPTVKPIKLIEYLIKLVSKEGAVVLDPFLGSGTTAIACLKLNRKFIGIEKEEEYIKIAEARIKSYLEQTKL